MSRYTSKHTGSEIDAAIDRAKAGGTIDTLLAGKAPAGFGYGDTLQLIGHDNITENDFVSALESVYSKIPNNTVKQVKIIDHPTLDGGAHFGHLWRSDKNYGALIVYSYFGFEPAPIIRLKTSGVWHPWEYVNPPMTIGEEYRTTERYMGKPVYVKLVDFGALPNAASKSLDHGIQNISAPFSIEGHITNSSRNAVGSADIWWSFTASKIIAGTTKDMSTRNAYVKIKYTKTTD